MAIIEQLHQLDDVETLPPTLDAIPADIDVLMLVHPQNLPDKTLFAIDQFVLNGGKALVFVDPVFRIAGGAAEPAPDPARRAPAISNRCSRPGGCELLPNVVAGDRRDARRVGVPMPGRGVAADGLHRLAQPAGRRISTATT